MDDLALLLETIREAGALALRIRKQGFKAWRKPDGTLVTEADIAVDALLKEKICAARPGDGWLSEESPDTAERLGKPRLWITDPIDGTRAFADGTRFWGIGVALTEGGAPLMSAIFCPDDDVLYHAVKGGGAFRNGVALTSPASSGPVILPRTAQAAVQTLGLPTQVSSNWPMLLRFALIAEGTDPGYIAMGPKQDWDIAAGVLMVTETGGIVSTAKGAMLRFNTPEHTQPGLVAAQQKWHHPLITAVGHF